MKIAIKKFNLKIDSRIASIGIQILSLFLVIVAIALHSPGQISMDTSVQLYEAHIGESINWHPPFMSALMKWMGGGELATAFIVLICSSLTYLSLGCVAGSILRNRTILGYPQIEAWRIVLCALLLLNPVLFIYVGIVWKDVLFASVMTAAIALSFAAAFMPSRRAMALGLVAVVLLTISMQVRQQGIFMAPLLLILPIIAIIGSRNLSIKRQALIAAGVIGVFLVSLSITQFLVDQSIIKSGDRSRSVGYKSIMNFDIAGTIFVAHTQTEDLPVKITDAQRAALDLVYTGRRIDDLSSDPLELNVLTDKQLKQVWLSLILNEPKAYFKHKFRAFSELLNLNGLEGHAPLHVGVDGNSDYLRAVSISENIDSRDNFIYRLASLFFGWPIYRHYFYLVSLLGCILAITKIVHLPARLKSMCLVLSLITGLFYLSFLPTMISSDFRFLFSGITLCTILWIVILTASLPINKKEK
jgi:hypothetical protein